jgi:hypothetical protein
MKSSILAMAALILLAGVPRQATADLVLYTNGPVDGNDGAWDISSGYAVTDSFTLTSNASLESATVGLLLVQQSPTDAPTTLDWSIEDSTSNVVASGTAVSLSNQDLGSGFLGAEVFQSSFALSGTLSAGTYYLTLQNGMTQGGSDLYWDQSGPTGGVSTATQDYSGSPPSGPTGLPSESFTIYAATPEPSTQMLAALGALCLIGYGWRRKQAAA